MSDEEFQYRCSPDRSLNGCGATPRVGTEAIPPELQSLEAALAALRPATPRLDRDRVMFVAGQASVTPRSRSWTQTAWRHAVPMAAAAAAAVLVTVWVWQPERQIVERLVYVPGPRPPIAAAEEPAAGVPEVVPESPAGGPAPIASIAPDRSLGLPIWLASWMGMELDDGNRLPWRRALT